MKRDDLINSEIPGNKWRKLKYNVQEAKRHGSRTLLTFGGAYSNHIRATAAAGYYFGFETVGVIRGEEHLPLNGSLSYAARRNMRLTYVDRVRYREKDSSELLATLHSQFGDFYLIPEGGSNVFALPGCAELVREIAEPFDVICCAVGTGGTLAGIASALTSGQRAIGFSALKGGAFLEDDVRALQSEALGYVTDNWSIETRYHFGGFARRKPALDEFIRSFGEQHGVDLDWVYVAKMLYGVFDLVECGGIAPGVRIVAVITG